METQPQPRNWAELCQSWRLEALSELTTLTSLLMQSDFSQTDYRDRIIGLADYADLLTDQTEYTRPQRRLIWPSEDTLESED